MDLSLYQARKKELNLTLDEISARSGVPLNTLKNIFSGRTTNPRIDTIRAIEKALGLETTKTELSADEAEWLDLYKQLKNVKGGKNAVQAVKSVILAFLDEK